MIYFGYLRVENQTRSVSGPRTRKPWTKTITKTKTARPETRGYPNQNRPAAILTCYAWLTPRQVLSRMAIE